MAEVSRIPMRGPLAGYASDFKDHLVARGYSRWSVDSLIGLLGHLSVWLDDGGLSASDLSASTVERFLSDRRAAGIVRYRSARALAPLMDCLRDRGALPPAAVPNVSPVQAVLDRFREYLLIERGVCERSASRYMSSARDFLVTRARPDGLHLADINAADVMTFVVVRCSGSRRGAATRTVSVLRVFLRFLHVEGLLTQSLHGAVPKATGSRLAALPKALEPGAVALLLASCDRRTEQGLRDYAILMLLTRVGLRAGEVAGLTLDDLDWRCGELLVRGKGGREDRLPLPADVGEAIVAYLRERRRSTDPGRALFVRLMAPDGPLNRHSVSYIVANGCRRIGLPVVRAHRLRHTVATELVHAGASLIEVGQLLRHRHVDTTAVYAKVDREGLRSLALPWPTTVVEGGAA